MWAQLLECVTLKAVTGGSSVCNYLWQILCHSVQEKTLDLSGLLPLLRPIPFTTLRASILITADVAAVASVFPQATSDRLLRIRPGLWGQLRCLGDVSMRPLPLSPK